MQTYKKETYRRSETCNFIHQVFLWLINKLISQSYNVNFYQTQNCALPHIVLLIVDGHWSSWTPWTICSLSCDSGYQSRHRHCNNPPPSVNRPYCSGKPFEILNCSITKCPGWFFWNYFQKTFLTDIEY